MTSYRHIVQRNLNNKSSLKRCSIIISCYCSLNEQHLIIGKYDLNLLLVVFSLFEFLKYAQGHNQLIILKHMVKYCYDDEIAESSGLVTNFFHTGLLSETMFYDGIEPEEVFIIEMECLSDI